MTRKPERVVDQKAGTMPYDTPTNAYEELTMSMRADEDYDVVIADEGLLVRGKLFAFLDGDELIVDLPESRARDLKQRGVAHTYRANGKASPDWVRVSDLQLWPELAREAHTYVGEPAVGGES